ncbi:hypothetical protein JXA80_00990 [bacterium]|nr:hypothetical protein [candidate division CSSED10-310 bacterium]
MMTHWLLKRILQPTLVLAMVTGMAACAYHRPRTHTDMIRYGIELAEKGYWTEAAVHWRMVLNEDPNNAAALNNLGVAAEITDHPEEAKRLLTAALAKRPDEDKIRRNLASVKERETQQNSRETDDEAEQ